MNTSQLIRDLGGNTKIAELCGISCSAVSQWKQNGIPKPWMQFFKVKRPDLFHSVSENNIVSISSESKK